jgi:hypothetical protein
MPNWPELSKQEWFWGKTEPWKTLHFQRRPWGWLFRSPICRGPFGLGPHTHYSLSDTQEAEVDNAFRCVNGRLVGFLLVMMLVPAPFLWFAPALSSDHELRLLIISAIYWLYVQLMFNVYWWLSLRHVLANAPRTSERIGFAERYSALAASMPSRSLTWAAIFCAVLAATEMQSFIAAKGSGAISLLGAFLVGATAIACIVMLLVKRKAKAGS